MPPSTCEVLRRGPNLRAALAAGVLATAALCNLPATQLPPVIVHVWVQQEQPTQVDVGAYWFNVDRVHTAAKSVVALQRKGPNGSNFGTGFVVSKNMLMTAGHVVMPPCGGLRAEKRTSDNSVAYGWADSVSSPYHSGTGLRGGTDIARVTLGPDHGLDGLPPLSLADLNDRQIGESFTVYGTQPDRDGALRGGASNRPLAEFSVRYAGRTKKNPAKEGQAEEYFVMSQHQPVAPSTGISGAPIVDEDGAAVAVVTNARQLDQRGQLVPDSTEDFYKATGIHVTENRRPTNFYTFIGTAIVSELTALNAAPTTQC